MVEFAKTFSAHVDIIHVAQDLANLKNIEVDPLLIQWRQANNYEKINLHLLKTNADAQTALKRLLKKIDADIIVMFHHDRNFWKSIFEKSTTAELVYEWTAPILTMHKK